MRVAVVGASSLAVTAARRLIDQGHEVVVIDRDSAALEAVGELLDCGLLHGDGSRPAVLDQLGPKSTDFLFCLSNRDEANILSALVGRSLGFGRVIPKVEDPDLEPICTELGLEEVLVPDRAGSDRICDVVEGRDSPAVSGVVRSGLRFFSFRVRDKGLCDVPSLALPADVRLLAYSRGARSFLIDPDTCFEPGDEVMVLSTEDRIQEMHDRFSPDADGRGT